MSFRKRILDVLNGRKPDKIPFFSFEELIPCGFFERELRNMGMGFVLLSSPLQLFSSNVSFTTQSSAKGTRTTYHTPKGDIYFTFYNNTKRIASPGWEVKSDFFIKNNKDYEALIFMIQDTLFEADIEEFTERDYELGEDGISHVVGPMPPYTEAQLLIGLEKWCFEQYDNTGKFNELLHALQKRTEKHIECLSNLNCTCLQHLGDISDNISPENYIEYEVPHYKKAFAALRSGERKVGIHIHAKFLARHKDWLASVKPDYVESYTPPPYSDISLPELRKALGEKVSILINFPEVIFYQGYEKTKKYTRELLESDSSFNKAIGFSEMGLMGVNSKNRKIFEEGFAAVAQAVNDLNL